jgi:hypothetical protein
LRGGNPEGKTNESASAERRGEGGFILAGPGNDYEFHETSQLLRLAPFGELSDMVGSNQVKEFSARETADVVANCFDSVRRPFALEFLFIDFAPVLSDQGKTQQLQAKGCGRRLLVWLKGGLGRQNEIEARQIELLSRGLGYQ